MELCKFEGCDRQVHIKKHGLCSAHYAQLARGQTLKPLTKKRKKGSGPCDFEGCENLLEVKGLCKGHYTQQYKGLPLTPLGSTYRQKRYTEEDKCLHEGCEEKPVSKDRCSRHYWQYKTYGYTYDGRREDVAVVENDEDNENQHEGKKFSTERYCPVCKGTFDWRAYYLEQKQCRECYRKSLSRRIEVLPDVGKGRKKQTDNWSEFLNFLSNV